MTVDQVIRLLDNGFTKEEIKAMEGTTEPAQEEAAQAEPAQAEQAQAEPVQAEPAQAEPAKPEPTETEKRLDSIESTMANLLKAVQTQNLKNDSFGAAGKSLEEQTDDIMATIIRGETARERIDAL